MITRPPAFLVPGMAPGRETEEVLLLSRLVADLARYASGNPPDERELAMAPLVTDWHAAIDTTALRLVGRIENHPTVRGPFGTTSRLHAVDPNGRWVRTTSRLWRTAPRAGT